MSRCRLAATMAGVTALAALGAVPGARAVPSSEPGWRAGPLASVVMVRAGGGRAEPGRSPALPESDRAAVQRTGRTPLAPPAAAPPATASPSAASPSAAPPSASAMAQPTARREPIDAGQRAALRRAGWAVPAKLADTWLLHDVHVIGDAGDEGGMLQLVYTRGGKRLSVFQRVAPVDWSGVPPNGSSVPELSGSVWEWPDAEPARLVWQARDRTFVVVGDVDRDELVRVAKALPDAETESVWRRLRRGLGELFARLSP